MTEQFNFEIGKKLTPEKSREQFYFETLKAKRDVLSSHYALNQLRRGKKVSEMAETDIEHYKSVKREYDRRRDLFLDSFANLSEEDGEKVSELTSLMKIEIALSSLVQPAEAVVQPEAPVIESPAPTAENGVSEPAVTPEVLSSPEEIVNPVDAESPDRGTNLAEVDRMLVRSQAPDRPMSPLEVAYWEAKKAELLQRQEAEANPTRPAPKGFMDRVRGVFSRAKERFVGVNAISGGSETVESRMNPLGLRGESAPSSFEPSESVPEPEIMRPEPAPVEPAPVIRPETSVPLSSSTETTTETLVTPEKEPRKASAWGWIKERGKGYLTFGLWELHQAERFRTKTKEVANNTEALASQIQRERNLSLEEAEKEAWEIVEELKKNNLNISAPEFYQANRDITDRKRRENDEEIEYIIKSAKENLRAKLGIGKGAFKEYRGWEGKDILTKEDELAFEADLRGELNKIRDGAMRKDFINFAKLIRRNLDQGWWGRYMWAFNEALMGFAGVGFLTMKWEAIQAAKLLAAEKAVTGGGAATEQIVTQLMNENVWNTLKEMAAKNGINLNPAELKELSQKVLDFNGMFEQEWIKGVADGLQSSRGLPQGFPIKIPVDVMPFLGFK